MPGLDDLVPPDEPIDDAPGIPMDEIDDDYYDEDDIGAPFMETGPPYMETGGFGPTRTYAPPPSSDRRSPIFQHSEQFPRATQLQVYHMEEGRPYSVGKIGIGATEADLIAKFRGACPGQFVLRPIDDLGNFLGEGTTLTISPHHRKLQEGANGTPPAGDGDPGMGMLLQVLRDRDRELDRSNTRLETERREMQGLLAAERAMLRDQMNEIASERVAMASQASSTTASISERMLEGKAADHRETFAAMTQLFQHTNSMMQEMIQWQAQAHQQAMERTKNDQQFTLERMLVHQDRESDRERSRQKEQRQVSDMARENDRAHYRALAEMNQRQGGIGGAKKMLSEFGLTPKDLFDALKGGEGGDTTIGQTLVGVLGEVAKSFANASGEAAKAQAREQTKQVQIAAATQNPQPQLEASDEDFLDEDFDEFEAVEPDQAPSVGSPPEVLAAFREAPRPGADALPLPVQKVARRAARAMVAEIVGAPSSEWADIITRTVLASPQLIQYARVSTIRKVLVEAGASGLEDQIIQVIDGSGLVPSDIPRN